MRVGRLVVSAITHTPASGPFGPETTPPISLAPTLTVACCAAIGRTPNARATAAVAALKYKPCFVFMSSPPLSVSEMTATGITPLAGNDSGVVCCFAHSIFQSRLQKQPRVGRETRMPGDGRAFG